MLNWGDRVEFSFWEAGCLIWVCSQDIHPAFCAAWNLVDAEGRIIGTDREALGHLIDDRRGAIALPLYQDDGYLTRVVLGELNQREAEDWTARCQGYLHLPTGELVVSGIIDGDEPLALLNPDRPPPEDLLQGVITVAPGLYEVTLYAYPPGDLSTGWGQIENFNGSGIFPPTPGISPENPWDYFHRTRPGETVPSWLALEYAPTEADRQAHSAAFYQEMDQGVRYGDFVVQLRPVPADTPLPPVPPLDGDLCFPWEFRKPDRCPLGLRIPPA